MITYDEERKRVRRRRRGERGERGEEEEEEEESEDRARRSPSSSSSSPVLLSPFFSFSSSLLPSPTTGRIYSYRHQLQQQQQQQRRHRREERKEEGKFWSSLLSPFRDDEEEEEEESSSSSSLSLSLSSSGEDLEEEDEESSSKRTSSPLLYFYDTDKILKEEKEEEEKDEGKAPGRREQRVGVVPTKTRTRTSQDAATLACLRGNSSKENAASFRVVVLTSDGKTSDEMRWRKYGQKFVKGSKYPRSYYKCTSISNMNIQKHVEEVDDNGGQKILVTFHTHSLDFAKELERKVPGSALIMPTD